MKKQLLVAGVATTIGLSTLGAGIVHAETSSTTTNTNPASSLVDAIASKFNLNKSDVQKVFDEQHTKMEAQRDQEVKDQLAQLVKDGKLTQAQAEAITAKRAELQKNRDADRTAMQNKTETERKAAMDQRKTDLEAWAKQNSIDTQYLRFVFGHGPHGPGGPRGNFGTPPSDTPAPNNQ